MEPLFKSPTVVDELRFVDPTTDPGRAESVMGEAADEIERLHEVIRSMHRAMDEHGIPL